MINTPTTLDPREMTDDLRHTGELSMLYRCAIAVAFIAALDRAEKAEAENKRLTLAVSYANLNADTAWNDAIEVAESRADNILQGYAIEKGNTKTPGGRTANFYRRKVKEAVVTLKKGAKP